MVICTLCCDCFVWNRQYDTGKFDFRCITYDISCADPSDRNCDYGACPADHCRRYQIHFKGFFGGRSADGDFYVICGVIVIIGNISNLPAGILMIFQMAFSVKAVGGGLCGTIVASMMNAMRYGVARGVFSNEAGMGSAAITAAAATTDNPVRQGYINMTGTFWDTIVVCTITGLAIASSGVLGMTDAAGNMLTGSDVTIAAFETVLGSAGGWLVTIGITLFAFSTILGWEYHGEKAFEYLLGTHRFNMVYRLVFPLLCISDVHRH